MTIESLQPYISLVNAIISVAVLTTIFNLIKTHRENINERINTLKDRLDGSKEDSERKDKWFLREKEQLEKEKREKETALLFLQTQLDEVLKREGITFEKLALGQTLKDSTNEVKVLIEDLSVKMLEQVKLLAPISYREDAIIADSQLTLAKAQMAKGDLNDAATNFEYYTSSKDASWEVYLSKAVTLANLRGGDKSNQESIRAYNDTINFLPKNVDPNMRARVFGYRGGILKRLNRLDEAEADLNIAIKSASAPREIDDIYYNFACVYAMQGKKEKMLSYISKISNKQILRDIKSHIHDYFKQFETDNEFVAALSVKPVK